MKLWTNPYLHLMILISRQTDKETLELIRKCMEYYTFQGCIIDCSERLKYTFDILFYGPMRFVVDRYILQAWFSYNFYEALLVQKAPYIGRKKNSFKSGALHGCCDCMICVIEPEIGREKSMKKADFWIIQCEKI